jgi:RNA polymerase sigma-70 factor (ECF subfamily)
MTALTRTDLLSPAGLIAALGGAGFLHSGLRPMQASLMRVEEPARLARLAGDGDEAAFRQLIELTHARMFQVALRVCGGRAEAEDAVQDAYLRAWQSLPRLREPSKVVGWLAAIARNAARDRMRARRRRPAPFLDEETERTAVALLTSDDPDGEAVIGSEQTRVVVAAALETIDEKFRVPMLLKDVDGLSGAEVAELLGVPVGTVESRATRGRAKLAKRLRKLIDEGRL